MQKNRSAANASEVEEIPHASTLSLAHLQAFLAQQEAESREALDKAYAGIRQAARYREAANKCEDNSRAARVRYEEAEIVIHELRKIIVEKNKQIIDGHVEPYQVRAPGKRRRSPSPGSNISRKRVAPTTDQPRDTEIKVEDDAAQLQINDVPAINDEKQRPNHQILEKEFPDGQTRNGTRNNQISRHDCNNDKRKRKTGFTPEDKVKAMALRNPYSPREREMLIYVSGQCPGRNKRKGIPGEAGCAVMFASETQEGSESIGFPLEQRGPDGVLYHDRGQKTAELRAFIGALEYKLWSTEGWKKVVVATSSSYVFRAITEYIPFWIAEGRLDGKYHEGEQLLNYNLWARALALVNEQAYRGCEVEVWKLGPLETKDVSVAARSFAKQAHAPPEAYRPLGDVKVTWTAERALMTAESAQASQGAHESLGDMNVITTAETDRQARGESKRAQRRLRRQHAVSQLSTQYSKTAEIPTLSRQPLVRIISVRG